MQKRQYSSLSTINWALAGLHICTASFLPSLVGYETDVMVVWVCHLVIVYNYYYPLIFVQRYSHGALYYITFLVRYIIYFYCLQHPEKA